MLEQLISYIQIIIAKYGVLGIFGATILEEVIAPIPSPLVPLAGGFFLLPATSTWPQALLLVLLLVAIPVAVGVSLGSSFVYLLGYFGGKPVVEKWGKWLGTSWADIEKAEQKLANHKSDELVLYSLRLLPVAPGVALSAFCGIIRYRFIVFLLTTFLGSMTRAALLGLIGWQVGDLYYTYAEILASLEDYLFFGLILVILLFGALYWRKRRKK